MTQAAEPIVHIEALPGTAKVPPLSLATLYGDLVFVSGTPGHDADRELAADFKSQFEQTAANLREILRRAGSDFSRVLKANVLLVRAGDVAEMNLLYAAAFGPAPYPARTTCVVQALPDPRMLIEIECVAVRG